MRLSCPETFAIPFADLPDEVSYHRGRVLDQGDTATSVEFALENSLRAQPCEMSDSRLLPRYTVYDEALRREFPSLSGGTDRSQAITIRSGCKVLKDHGLIASYKWAYLVDDVLKWMLSGHGGVVLGIDWHSAMDEPDDEGIIRVKGHHAGGLAIYAYGVCRSKGFINLFSAWGTWGGWKTRGKRDHIGCCKLPLEDLALLFRGNAEACTLQQVPYNAAHLNPSLRAP